MLITRYQEYQQKVVKAFYKHHFSTFDRQIVLVDCLQPLNAGNESFLDMRQAIEQIMHSFKYGRSNILKRLFAPKIDKILFAATKADHVTPEQHPNLVSLLQQMVYPAWQTAAYDNIEMSCIAMASIQATQSGFISHSGESMPAIQGVTNDGETLTVFERFLKSYPDPIFGMTTNSIFILFGLCLNLRMSPCRIYVWTKR